MTAHRFDIGTAIFYFFKRFGENPGGAIWIAVCQTAIVLALGAGALAIMAPAWDNLVQLILLDEAGQLTDEEAVTRVFGVMGPTLIVMLLASPLGIIAALMFQGAWLRFLTKGEVKPGIPFRLGGDEIRLLGVNLLYIVLAVVAYAVLGGILLASGVGTVLIVDGAGGGVAAGLGMGLVMALVAMALFVIVLVVAVRLASAPAMTVQQGRFRFFESWQASRGVFWHLLVSYIAVGALIMVLSWILGVVVQLLAIGALLPLILAFVRMDGAGIDPDPQLVFDTIEAGLANPVAIGGFILTFVVAYMLQIMLAGMWHSIGAYNAVRHDGKEGADLDAPVLGADHPMGASPGEG